MSLRVRSLMIPAAAVILLGGISTWGVGCGSDDEPAGKPGSGAAAGSGGQSSDSSVDGQAGEGGSSGAPDDSSKDAAALGESCESLPCTDGLFCSEDPCTDEFCTQTCKKTVTSCTAQPSPCATGEVCVTDIEFPNVRSYCIPAAKAGAACDPTGWDTCESGFYCGRDTSDGGDPFTRLCKKRSAGGQPCNIENGSCVDGFRCQNEVCVARKPAGSACVGSSECLENSFCSQDTGTCEAVHQTGGPCRASNAVCAGSECLYFSDYCAAGLVCDKDGATGCFHDTNCTGSEQFCCLPGVDSDAGADAAVVEAAVADAGNYGMCTNEFKCLRPLGKCAAPPSP